MNNEYIEEQILVSGTKDLQAAIKRLERKKMLMEEDLKEHLHLIIEDLKPANILKTTIHEVQESIPLKYNLLKIALGLGVGYFSRKLIVGKSAGLVKKALGTALQFGITQLVARKNNVSDADNFVARPKKKGLLKRILST